MKSLQRFSLLLLSLVMCLSLFAVPVSAAVEDLDSSNIYLETFFIADKANGFNYTFYPNNDTVEGQNCILGPYPYPGPVPILQRATYIKRKNGNILFPAGRKVDFWVNNAVVSTYIRDVDTGNGEYYYNINSNLAVYIAYTDGTELQIGGTVTTENNRTANIKFSFTPTKDVKHIYFNLSQNLNNSTVLKNSSKYEAHCWIGETSISSWGLQYEQQSEELGLLDKIKGGIDNLKQGIDNVVTGITELPAKLWEKIETGLKNLFVPSEESMTAYKDKWDSLLSERLGAVYQVCDIVTNSWSEISNADATDTINFPSATIDLPDDAQFTFGGYDVKIVPEGFDVLVQAIKLIVGIVCTLAFINGMLKRYDEVMGVEQ